jgi:hypothetical protein
MPASPRPSGERDRVRGSARRVFAVDTDPPQALSFSFSGSAGESGITVAG